MTRRRIIAGVILLAAVAGMVCVIRRWECPPGRAVVADQVCFDCLVEKHDNCLRIDDVPIVVLPNGKIAGFLRSSYLEQDRVDIHPEVRFLLEYPPDFRCTCTDPSHDGDSE